MTAQQYVLVGAGLTAARAIESLRDNGFDGSVVLIGDEQRLPYERPPLSKEVLAGAKPAESAFPHPQSWYSDNAVDLRLGRRATEFDSRRVLLDDDTQVPFDKLLLATGSRARRLDVPGAELDGVLTLRTMSDSLELLDRLQRAESVVIIGGGWIGLEVAAAARHHGCRVSLVEPASTPLFAVMGPLIGGWFADLHRSNGVDLALGDGVERIEGPGRVQRVLTTSGAVHAADLVVVGVGAIPNLELAADAGLRMDNGVRTDAALRTSAAGVFAAGDIACYDHPVIGQPIRTEHWANAFHGGAAAGLSMLGKDVSYDRLPYFYTDQYDAGMEYLGYVPPGVSSEPTVRGDPASGSFMAFWLDDGRILAAMHVNQWDSLDAVEPLIVQRSQVDATALADVQVPIEAAVTPTG